MQPRRRVFEGVTDLVTPQLVERRSSPHNPVLEVVRSGDRVELNAASVNYSFGTLHRMFAAAFERLRLAERRCERALLLGVGGGSVVALLRRLPHAPRTIVAVEIDPVVVELARTHFGLVPSADLEIVTADAAEFVSAPHAPFDLVVVDVFVNDEIPAQCQTPEFMRACARLLSPGGWLVANRMAHTPGARAEAQAFASMCKRALGTTLYLNIDDNLVLVHEAAT